jgi:hypothetical protein
VGTKQPTRGWVFCYVFYKALFAAWGETLGGKLKVIDGQLFFVPEERTSRKQVRVPIDRGSSAIKSLVALDLYLQHIAQRNDILRKINCEKSVLVVYLLTLSYYTRMV